jgi:hypothetical protein
MTSTPPALSDAVPEMDAAELAGLGITLVSTAQYHVGPYRYGSLAEAVAETRRRRVPGNDS